MRIGGAWTRDVLVIGGGILRSRVAFDAARSGLRVGLVDAGDFGGATSGASARLIHGGLRYLGTGGVRLVRAALRERDILASRIAPHLVRPLPFVLSVAGERHQRSRCAAGLLAYVALGGFRRPLPRFATPEEAALLVPPLRIHDLASHAIFSEAVTNDSRLTLATVTAAACSGAVVANHLRAVDLELGEISRVSLRGLEGTLAVRCRAVVNATLPEIGQNPCGKTTPSNRRYPTTGARNRKTGAPGTSAAPEPTTRSRLTPKVRTYKNPTRLTTTRGNNIRHSCTVPTELSTIYCG
jgi:glycerol-3-phosphate dehydrogenase